MELIAEETEAVAKDGKTLSSRDHVFVSCIVAVQNVEADVARLYADLSEHFQQHAVPYEIVFVDDGSTDNTLEVLTKLSADAPELRVVRMRSSFGEAAAFDAGLKQAAGNNIVFTTSRVRIDPKGISRLLEWLEDGYDLVVGWRSPRADSKLNQFVSRVFNWLVRSISSLSLHDINSGVLVARRQVLENVSFYGNLNIFLPILADRKGFRVTEEKIAQLPGSFRQSRYVSEYLQRLLDIVSVIFLTKYSKKPLHFLGLFGMIFTIFGLVTSLYLFIYRLFQFGPIAGRPLLLLGALSLVIGLQMIGIGLIGEMIIFTHANDIKEYSIERIVSNGVEVPYDEEVGN
jgi:glycosyltransferase involved in cell wall biosynthesis